VIGGTKVEYWLGRVNDGNSVETRPRDRSFPGRWLPFFVVSALAIGTFSGCRKDQVSPGQQSQQSQFRHADRGEALLNAATSQLADLPSAVDTELRPPVVILDSTKSLDHNDVLAICMVNPHIPGGPINYIRVPSGNGRFRSLNVQPGDILKYYVLQDETVDEESRQAGFSRALAMDLNIAQVIDDNTLIVDSSLNQEVSIPAKIEIWRYVDDRLVDIKKQLEQYIDRRLALDRETDIDAALGWEPAADGQVLNQIITWLNQWVRQSNPKIEWQRDPIIDSLDSGLTDDEQLRPFIAAVALAAPTFNVSDGRILQEAVWLRDISRWGHGNTFDDLARASALFDWTVRNIQLEPDENELPRRPWQILLHGRGTAAQRAWVFALLCRHQRLNAVVLALPPLADESTQSGGADARFWLVAVLIKGQLYLFDTRLGLPIPGPDGKGVATLEQVLQDEKLLRQLDLDGVPYPVTSEAVKRVEARVVADHFDLSRRAQQVESNLAGDDRLALATRPRELEAQLKLIPGLNGIKLWDLPFRTLRDQLALGKSARQTEGFAFEPFAVRPILWKARTRHFQGRRKSVAKPGGEPLDDHHEAAQLYTNKDVRPTEREIAKATSGSQRRVESTAKLNATYWLGLVSFDDGNYEVAAHWFAHPELTKQGSPWITGARYNLARTLEMQDKLDEAIKLLETDTGPQQHGNKLRARQLKTRLDSARQGKLAYHIAESVG
jgi:hypothetical protein